MNFKEAFFGPLNEKPGFSLAILRCQAADFGGWCDQQKLFRCGKLDGTVQVQEKLAKEAGLLEVPCFYSDWPPGRMEKLCRIKKLCTRICSFKLKSLKTAVLIQLPEVAGWVALLQLEVWITEDFVHLYSRARTHLNILDFTRCIDVWHQHIILCDAKHRWMPREKKKHIQKHTQQFICQGLGVGLESLHITLVICEKTFPGQSHEAQSSEDAETWEVTFEGLISIGGISALRCQVQEIEIRGVVETGGITKLWLGFHPCN